MAHTKELQDAAKNRTFSSTAQTNAGAVEQHRATPTEEPAVLSKTIETSLDFAVVAFDGEQHAGWDGNRAAAVARARVRVLVVGAMEEWTDFLCSRRSLGRTGRVRQAGNSTSGLFAD